MGRERQFIRASEVGEYVFCARAWRLRLDGQEATGGHAARAFGEAWHNRHGRSVRRALILRRLSALSATLALLLVILLLLLWWR